MSKRIMCSGKLKVQKRTVEYLRCLRLLNFFLWQLSVIFVIPLDSYKKRRRWCVLEGNYTKKREILRTMNDKCTFFRRWLHFLLHHFLLWEIHSTGTSQLKAGGNKALNPWLRYYFRMEQRELQCLKNLFSLSNSSTTTSRHLSPIFRQQTTSSSFNNNL